MLQMQIQFLSSCAVFWYIYGEGGLEKPLRKAHCFVDNRSVEGACMHAPELVSFSIFRAAILKLANLDLDYASLQNCCYCCSKFTPALRLRSDSLFTLGTES